jgi:hypothetical protein
MAKKSRQQKPGKPRYQTNKKTAAEDLQAAIRERRFRPWHAAVLLDMAETASDLDRAVQTITALVGTGQRREVLRESAS